MVGGETERLRFRIFINNRTSNDQIDPTIRIGIRSKKTFTLVKGINEIVIDETIRQFGTNILQISVIEDQTQNNFMIGTFDIENIIINGSEVWHAIFDCKYYPKLDDKDEKIYLDSVLSIGNRGTWQWLFTAPTYKNETLKLGLW